MALHNIPASATGHGGNSVTIKVPKKLVQLIVLIAVIGGVAFGLLQIGEPLLKASSERQQLENDVLKLCASFYPQDEAEIVELGEARRLAKEYSSTAKYDFLNSLDRAEARQYVFIKFSNKDTSSIGLEIYYREDGNSFNRVLPSD